MLVLVSCSILSVILVTIVCCDGECCPQAYVDHYTFWNNKYCADGTAIRPYKDSYCGYGPCNVFGCNCNGGCRRHESEAHTYTMYGEYCVSTCQLHYLTNNSYYWCQTRDSWDYCSPKPSVDIHGLECRDECGPKGQRYSWCYRQVGGWQYCGAAPAPPNSYSRSLDNMSISISLIIFALSLLCCKRRCL